jgi:zinc protease
MFTKLFSWVSKTLSLLCFGIIASMLATTAQAGVKIQQWKTAQGAQVLFVENHDLPILDISTGFHAGSARDADNKTGVAGLTRFMMTLGAGGLSDEQIAKKMADIGATLGGGVNADQSSFTLRTLSNQRERSLALDIYRKILQQPDFPAAVLSREKARVIAGIQESMTQPESISNKAFYAGLYGNHPYGKDEDGDLESVKSIQANDLKQFYQQYYGAKSAVIAMIGDISRSEAEQIADSLAAGLPQAEAPAALPKVSYPTALIEKRIPHPATQAHILLGYPGIKRGDEDYFPLYVGNYILGGGGFVSRLTEEVREKRGLVYSVYSYFMPLAELGPFQVGLQTKKEQANEALTLVRATLQAFIDNGPNEAELKAAKQNITGGFPLRLDSNSKILEYLALIGFYQLPLSYLDDFNQRVNQVTTAQIKQAFQRRIQPANMVTVVVGAESP